MNKKEILYNAQSLIEVWLGKYKEEFKAINGLRWVCDGKNANMIVPCTLNDVGEKLSEILYKEAKNYNQCRLIGSVDLEEVEFGKIDIK